MTVPAIKRIHVLALFSLATFVVPTIAEAAPGDLDPSFGNGGKVTTDLGGTDDEIVTMALDSQGRIVAAGVAGATYHATLARYDPDGSLDRSFGGDGIVTVNFGDGASFAVVSAVAIDSQGRIIAAGASRGDLSLARYHPDGSLDRSFGSDGITTTDFGGEEYVSWMALDSQGRIVTLGQRGSYRGWLVLARYTPDGSLDPSFSGDGKAITGISRSATRAVATSVAIDARDRIIAGGYVRTGSGGDDFALIRYSVNGIVTSRSFGTRGRVITDFGADESAGSVAIDSQGRIVQVGDTDANSDFALARYHPDGSLDRSFSGDGRVTTAVGGSGGSVAIDSQGRIVVGGYSHVGSDSSAFALVRYNPNGSRDPSFGAAGVVTTDFGADTQDGISKVSIDSQGRIVAVGAKCGDLDCDFALARYLG